MDWLNSFFEARYRQLQKISGEWKTPFEFLCQINQSCGRAKWKSSKISQTYSWESRENHHGQPKSSCTTKGQGTKAWRTSSWHRGIKRIKQTKRFLSLIFTSHSLLSTQKHYAHRTFRVSRLSWAI